MVSENISTQVADDQIDVSKNKLTQPQTLGEIIEALEENGKEFGEAIINIIRIDNSRLPRGPRSG